MMEIQEKRKSGRSNFEDMNESLKVQIKRGRRKKKRNLGAGGWVRDQKWWCSDSGDGRSCLGVEGST